jgi:flagellar hook protein FlgE
MSFETAISGLQAATTDLNVIGNNLANAGSVGFKSSRALFADVYAANSSAKNAVGMGAKVAGIDQSFNQGALNLTNKTLDLAIDDKGFFGLADRGTMVYTRAGAFTTDSNGYIVNKSGQRLIGYLADGMGGVSGQRGDLRIDTSIAAPKPTKQAGVSVNLDTRSVLPKNPWLGDRKFGDPPPAATTYNNSTSQSIFDELGNSHELQIYYVLQDPEVSPNTWDVHALIDGASVGDATGVAFDSSGNLVNPDSAIKIEGWQPLNPSGGSNGAGLQDINVSLANTTLSAYSFSVTNQIQDGCTSGQLNRIAVDESGVITGYYSNNQSRSLGQVALFNFANVQGLKPLGDTSWGETPDSGTAQIGAPGTAGMGSVQSGSLEQSNVDVATELVNLILAQRNYQANAQTIAASDKVTQTILNIR